MGRMVTQQAHAPAQLAVDRPEQLQLEAMGNRIIMRLAQQDNILVMHGIDDVVQAHLLTCIMTLRDFRQAYDAELGGDHAISRWLSKDGKGFGGASRALSCLPRWL